MQQRRAAIHLALLLSLSSHTFYAAYAQVGPGGLSPSPSPDPGLPGGVTSSPSPNPSVSPSPNPSVSPSPGPSVSPSVTSSPTPGVIPPGTSPGSSSGAPSPSPSPAATTIPTTPLPGTPSPSPGTGVTPSPDSPTPIPGPSPSPEPPKDIGWLMPVPDETAIDNVTTRDECALTSALFGVMGANYSTKCNGSSSSGGSSGTPTFSEYRSGVANRGGLVTTAAGAQFCVSHDAAHQVAAESTRLQFASVDGFKRQLPNVYDPACDDPDAIYRPECSGPPVSASFYEDVTSNNLITSPSPDDGSGSDQVSLLNPDPGVVTQQQQQQQQNDTTADSSPAPAEATAGDLTALAASPSPDPQQQQQQPPRTGCDTAATPTPEQQQQQQDEELTEITSNAPDGTVDHGQVSGSSSGGDADSAAGDDSSSGSSSSSDDLSLGQSINASSTTANDTTADGTDDDGSRDLNSSRTGSVSTPQITAAAAASDNSATAVGPAAATDEAAAAVAPIPQPAPLAAAAAPTSLPSGSSSGTDDGSSDSSNGNQLGVSPAPDPEALVNCSTKFTRAGSNPRSVAIILLRWDRKYYKTKEECCEEQDNKPGCDCNWGGFSYDNLPPPKAYSRLFTDECDQGPSINRAYYDLSGGKVTFHGKLRVPVPQGTLVDPEADNTTEANTIPGAMAAPVPSTTSDGSTAPEPPPAPAPVPPPPATPPAPYVVPTEPIETATSYQDPNGVDVYGWATLPGMRTPQGYCSDWCGDAMKQLGVNENDYNHVMCLQLLASKALCDTCKGDCIGTCPVTSGITTGCGCATCYYAWGGQTGCNRPAPPGIRVGMAANSKVYEGDMLGNAGGPFIAVAESLKQFVSHEIGHNMGLTHTGSVSCKVNGDVVMREPQFCTPDWYGDFLGFMGSSSSLSLPNALRYKVRWLPRATLRTHPQGEEQTYALRAATSRRPSWQNTTSESVRWFTRDDTLTVRVQMRNPPGSNQNISSYSCPCGSNYGGSCPESCGSSTCEDGPCCLDIACADKGLNWLYIELHQPYRNDYESSNAGIAIRMFGELSECTSTRLVPAYAKDGQPVFLLTKADPTGQTPGSKFEDTFRGVRVVLESWNKSRATIRVWSA